MHLGMSGRFSVAMDGTETAPGEFHLEPGAWRRTTMWSSASRTARRVTYNDARRFGFMDLVPRSELETMPHFSRMGIEPLGNELSGEAVARLFAGKRTPLKAALLDQRLIAGLGNIYVSRGAVSHRAASGGRGRLARDRPRAARPRAPDRLAEVIRDVLDEAVVAGGSTLRDHQQVDGTLGYFQHRFRVYDREGEACPTPALQRHRPAPRAIGPLDLLLPALPAAQSGQKNTSVVSRKTGSRIVLDHRM